MIGAEPLRPVVFREAKGKKAEIARTTVKTVRGRRVRIREVEQSLVEDGSIVVECPSAGKVADVDSNDLCEYKGREYIIAGVEEFGLLRRFHLKRT